MGNFISNHKNYSFEEGRGLGLKMSNGLTSVFISILSMSMSELAKTEDEIDFAIWIASHDQGVFGIGIVGFDIGEMPWKKNHFETEKSFVLRAVDLSKSKSNWSKLDYSPHEEWVMSCMDKFQRMIADFSVELIRPDSTRLYRPETIGKCERHGVYLHTEGCVVCND